ncbi:DgyrCDS3432 [Dimorphilus gyrociliatus]|uniref:DgyrCDS3432 n=1 Tax=Dimorphilus gyrociliatus TaxID=2664684 RepID=A0A7I8VEA5_9ANNE|nr:DgyrCDS3432 [Dimorphilus gyrociliatus]
MFGKFRSQENFVPTQHVSRKDEYERRVPPRPRKIALSKSIENVSSSSTSITVLRTPPSTPKSAAAQLQAERNKFDQAVDELEKCYDEILKVSISEENAEKLARISRKIEESGPSVEYARSWIKHKMENKTYDTAEAAERKREEERRLQILHEDLYLNRRKSETKKDSKIIRNQKSATSGAENHSLTSSTEYIINSNSDCEVQRRALKIKEAHLKVKNKNAVAYSQEQHPNISKKVSVSRKQENNENLGVRSIPSKASEKFKKTYNERQTDQKPSLVTSPISVEDTLNHHSNLHVPNPVYPPLDYRQTSPKPTRNRIGSGVSAFRAVKNGSNAHKNNSNSYICNSLEQLAGKCITKKPTCDQISSFMQLVCNFENKLPRFMKKY